MRSLTVERTLVFTTFVPESFRCGLRRIRRRFRHAARTVVVSFFRQTRRVDPALWWLYGVMFVGVILLYLVFTDTSYHADK